MKSVIRSGLAVEMAQACANSRMKIPHTTGIKTHFEFRQRRLIKMEFEVH